MSAEENKGHPQDTVNTSSVPPKCWEAGQTQRDKCVRCKLIMTFKCWATYLYLTHRTSRSSTERRGHTHFFFPAVLTPPKLQTGQFGAFLK